MNIYKKLFLVIGLFAQSINFYANSDLPSKDDQDEQAQVQLNENETLLILFLQQGQSAEYIQDMRLGAIQEFQQLEKIKKYVRDEQFKKPIENIEQHLTEQKKYLSNLHTFLSKKELDLTDIQQFAPEFSKYKYMFFQSNDPVDVTEAKHAEIQERNLILLSRLQEIEEKRSQNNLGSWMRKSPFFEKIYKEKRQE